MGVNCLFWKANGMLHWTKDKQGSYSVELLTQQPKNAFRPMIEQGSLRHQEMHAHQMNMATAAHHKPQQRKEVLPLSNWLLLWLGSKLILLIGMHKGGSLYCKLACQM